MLLGAQELQRIRDHQPEIRPEASLIKAAVAIILRDGDMGSEVLLMQRAKHERDPWSGQMSFPGGKIDPQDLNPKAAAIREAHEEVGAHLPDTAFVGQLDDLYGLKVNDVFSVHVSCFVFKPLEPLSLVANEEVADMVWLPLKILSDRKNSYDYEHPKDPSLSMPAVMIDEPKEQILWGLSLRMLANLYDLIDWPIQVLSDSDKEHLRNVEKLNLSNSSAEKITRKITQTDS